MPRRKPKIVSRADMARFRGVSRSAVTKACRVNGPLHEATIDHGDRVDMGHPAARAWLARRPIAELQNFISIEEMAARTGRSVDEVRQATAPGGELEDATPIDLDHPCVRRFLASRGVRL